MLEALGVDDVLVGGPFEFTTLAAVGGLARFGPGAETSPPTFRGEAPTVVGETYTGAFLRVYGGDFTGSPTAIDVRWLRCSDASCTPTGQWGWGYTVSDADKGYRLRAELVASNDAGASAPVLSSLSAVALGRRPFAIYPAYPYVWGAPRVGSTLTVDPGVWDPPATSYRFTWRRCTYAGCTAISSGPSPTYTLTAADVDFDVAVSVVAINAAGESSSFGTRELGPVVDGPPSGQSYAPDPWKPVPGDSDIGDFMYGNPQPTSSQVSLRIDWLRCDANGNACTRVSQLQAHPVTTADVGHTFRQAITLYSTAGASTERISDASDPIVAQPTPSPTPIPSASPSPSPVATPPANSYPTGTPAPSPTPGGDPSPTASPSPGGDPSPTPTASPTPNRDASPSPRHLTHARPRRSVPARAHPRAARPATHRLAHPHRLGPPALRPRTHGHRPAARRTHTPRPRPRDGQAPRGDASHRPPRRASADRVRRGRLARRPCDHGPPAVALVPHRRGPRGTRRSRPGRRSGPRA